MLIAQNAVSRPRPYAYYSDADRPEDAHYDVTLERTFQSMPSGHSTSAWCAASFTMTDHLLTHPNASWKEQAAVGFTMGLLASSTSLLRVEAEQHFPTDVMVGAAIGMAGGVLVPLSHRYLSAEGRAPMPPKQSWLASFLGSGDRDRNRHLRRRFVNTRISAGSTTSVSTVDERMPPITTVASGRCTSAPVPVAMRHRKESERRDERGHQDGPQAGAASLENRVLDRPAVVRELAHERHHDEPVQHGHARERDEADRRGDRDRHAARQKRQDAAGQRERHAA